MRSFWLGLLVAGVGCSGISIGGSSANEGVPRCADERREPISDSSQPAHGFERSPNELLDPVLGTFDGTLDLADGGSVPISVEISIDSSLQAVTVTDSDGSACEPFFTATVAIDIDAGPALQGTVGGYLVTRNQAEIHADPISFDTFEGTLQTPDFGGAPLFSPYLVLDFRLGDDGHWQSEWQLQAQIETDDCAKGVPTCVVTVLRPLGKAVLKSRADE